MAMGKIWGIILAAGESKRMGFPKMLLDFNGLTMIQHVLKNVTGSQINEVMVVLGAHRNELMGIIRDYPVKYCINSDYKDGMLSSVRCGLRNISADCDAVLVFQGDQPYIPCDVINSVIDAYRGSDKDIVIPVHKKKRGHPIMFNYKYIEFIENIDIADGLRILPRSFHEDVLELETEESGILKDFDTFEEYSIEINQTSKYGRKD